MFVFNQISIQWTNFPDIFQLIYWIVRIRFFEFDSEDFPSEAVRIRINLAAYLLFGAEAFPMGGWCWNKLKLGAGSKLLHFTSMRKL